MIIHGWSSWPGLFAHPLTPQEAIRRVREWMAQEPSVLPEPGPRHLSILSGFLEELGTGGNLVSDAHLAALAVEHRATVITFDNDFDRFPGVAWTPRPKTSSNFKAADEKAVAKEAPTHGGSQEA